ncbi:MAG: VOC family protein [Acidimicrobiales bacterium]
MSEAAALAGGPVQIAYGVADVRRAADRWVERLGAGPFFVRDHIPVSDAVIGGSPAPFDHSSAYGQWGAVMVELVAIHDPPALATDGLHHVAYFVDSFDQAASELGERGWPQVLSARAGPTRFAFHDARPDLGHLIEIYEPSATLRGFYDMVADASDGWRGDEPVRILG